MNARKKRPLEQTQCALLIATADFMIQFARPRAKAWLAEFFRAPKDNRLLPLAIQHWLAETGPKTAPVIKKDEMRIFLRRYRPHPPETIALFIEVIDNRSPGDLVRKHASLTQR